LREIRLEDSDSDTLGQPSIAVVPAESAQRKLA
jgi:hypothetical protein